MFVQVRNLQKLFFLVLIFKTPVYSWGFSLERTQSYLEKAEKLNLAADPQWIKLGHYKKTHDGYKSPFKEGLFIHENGANSPADELMATIVLLYSEALSFKNENKNEHPQCYYLARTLWLNRVLKIDSRDQMPCSDKMAWKKDLNARSVSLIFAAGDLSNAASIFGHTFLKLNNPKNQGQKDLLNYGIDYSAEADASEGIFYAVKGLFGFYPGQFAMLPFHQKILEYTNVEGRDIWEFKLNFTPAETDFLISHLLEMEKARAPYFFADDNCSTQILRTLEVVRPELNLADSFSLFVVPIETVKLVERTPALVENVIYKPALKTDFDKAFRQLSSEQRSFFPSLIQNLNFKEAPNEFSKLEKAQLLETAAAALALESFRKKIDLEEKTYQLYLQRIELGQGVAPKVLKKPASPILSHDSFAMMIGSYNGGQTFKLRSAFHDLEQPHDGLIPHSHIEVLALSARSSELTQKLNLDRFTFLRIMNLNPSSALENKLAWKASIEFLDRFRPDWEGSLGTSYAVSANDELRFSTFMTARYWEESFRQSDQVKDGKWIAAGPELLLSFHPINSIGLSLSTTYFFVDHNQDFLRNKFRLNWNFATKFDLQLSHENFIEPMEFNDSNFENRLSIVFSTIL